TTMDDQGTFFTDHNEADLESMFAAAVELTSNAERAVYLDRACAHDPKLRAEVEKLLAADADAGDFMRDTDAPDTEPPGTRIGPYELLQVIGEGGMGTVYMAEQAEPVERRVALKIIKRGMASSEITARFEAERQALALMDHPNIAKVFDAGATETGRPYFVMELVKGIPITEYCDQYEYGPRQRLELFIRVCHAVQHAHQKGIIHRDIKPANVLVADYGNEVAPKVIDFGIAKATGPQLTEKTMYTQLGQIVGTFEYMSPEQAKLDQLDIDTRSDIYALGVLLYEMLTGTTPFERARLQTAGFEEILRIIREEEPPKPSTRISTLGDRTASVTAMRRSDLKSLQRDLRGELDWIVMRAMEKDRSRRYESASGLAADVERYLNGEPVRACPPSTAYRLRKFVRRHRGPVIAAAAVLLTLCLGLGGTSAGLIQAVEAREAQRKLTFGMALDRGLKLCDDGHVGHGMLWLARALEICPPDATEQRRVVRANLNAWRRELNSLEAVFPHAEPVIGVAFRPDGAMLATVSNDDTAQRWDVTTGARIGAPLPHSGDAHEAVFSSDGTRLLTSDYGTTAFLWDAETGALLHRFDHDARLVPGAAFRPPEDRQVVTSGGRVVTIWDAESGARVGALPDHPHLVHDVAVSADGSRILTACHDNHVRLWDFDSHELLAIIEHETRVPTVDFAGEGDTRIASGDSDGNVYLWDLADALADAEGTARLSVAAGDFVGRPGRHLGGVHRLRAGPDGKWILSASFDNTARMWDAASGAEAGAPFEHQTACQAVVFSADGSRIATTCDDNAARVWRPAVGQVPRVVEHPTETHEAVYTSDGRYILIKRDEETVLVRDAETGATVCEFAHAGAVRVAAATADGSRILIGSENQTCLLVDTATGRPLFPPFRHASGVWAVALSP
ncbi:MAG: WD40 repeat domain-containing serine/threonine protein kinase, partial [Planctomycetota bacterium]